VKGRNRLRPFLTPMRRVPSQRVVHGGERILHGTSCVIAHTRHDVGVGVQGYRYGGVSQELLDELEMSSFA
jgi:hypothetical protein